MQVICYFGIGFAQGAIDRVMVSCFLLVALWYFYHISISFPLFLDAKRFMTYPFFYIYIFFWQTLKDFLLWVNQDLGPWGPLVL